ncbi:MAG: ATP-binding protein [Thermoanaerobaculia bacterium]
MRSIRARLSLWLLVGSSALVAGGMALLWHQLSQQLEREFDGQLNAEAEALAGLLTVSEQGLDFDFADETFPQYSAPVDPAYFEVRLGDGALFEHSLSLAGPDHGVLDVAPRAGFADIRLPDGTRARRLTLGVEPRPDDEESVNDGAQLPLSPLVGEVVWVTVARSRSRLDAVAARFRYLLLSWAAVMIVGVVILVAFVLDWSLRPLARLAGEIAGTHPEHLDRRLSESGLPSEIAPVVRHWNELLDRLEISFRRESEFSSNIAHELKTPLAELRALCEVTAMAPVEPQAAAEFFADVGAIGRQMESIVESLLDLIRSAAPGEALVPSRFSAREAIDQACRPFAALCRQRQLEVRVDCAPELIVETDRDRFAAILTNLISNAVTYARPGSWVDVQGRGFEGGTRIEIANPAPDLVAEDLPRLFDRFWRKSASRETDGHTGLGLALVAVLARRLGVEVRARLSENQILILAVDAAA